MLYKLFIFLLFLSPLVFFHELGHFLFARLFGVRVEVFSIGFGKKLFSFVRGDTEYRFSLIPLGGFVKMYGDDPFGKEKIPEDEKRFAFNHKSKFARFWIVFGGPLANFIMAFALYFGLISKGEMSTVFKVGELNQESKLRDLGFQTGDEILKVNNQEVYAQEDFIFLEEEMNTFQVQRGEGIIEIQAPIEGEELLKDFYGNSDNLVDPYFLDKNNNKVFVYHQKEVKEKYLSIQEMIKLSPEKVFIFSEDREKIIDEVTVDSTVTQALRKRGYFSLGLAIKRVVPDSPASKAKLQENDIIIGAGSSDFHRFPDLRDKIQENKDNPLKLNVIRNGEIVALELTPAEKKYGERFVYTIGVESSVELHRPEKRYIEGKGIIAASRIAFKRTYAATYKTLEGFKKIFFSEGSLGSIGGPVAIATVASDSLSIGLEHFFRLMAIISINLAIINLFPIPVLDGGHILFLVLEGFNRGPLTRKKMEIAQQFGLSLLFLLLSIAIFNDVSRYVVPMFN